MENHAASQNKRNQNKPLYKLQDNDQIGIKMSGVSVDLECGIKQNDSDLSAGESDQQASKQQYVINFLKPIKQPTRASLSFHYDNEQKEQNRISEIPQPSETSEAQSHEAKYLSHLNHYVEMLVNAAAEQDEFLSMQAKSESQARTISSPIYHAAINIVYRCVLYLKKESLITQIDDMLLHDDIKQHIQVRIHPQKKNQIGQMLLENGWFLAAYAVMMARIYASHFILRYIFNSFAKHYNLQSLNASSEETIVNAQQFLFYKNRVDLIELFKIADAKGQQIFTAPVNHQKGQNTKHQRVSSKQGNLKRQVVRQKTLGSVEELIQQRIAQKHDSSE